MDVVIADHAGACYGVNRALRRVESAEEQSSHVFTLGPLIHNPQVVDDLKARGVGVAETLDDVEPGDTLVIRSHGVAPSTIVDAKARGLKVEDATCPYVAKVQRAAAQLAEEGLYVIIVGEAGHPEVEGIRACVDGPVCVVSSPEDVPIVLPDRVGVVVQTTQSRELLDRVLSVIRDRSDNVVLRDTICFATQQRQESAAVLSARADVMVVIGGRNSGNTRRLFDICRTHCPRSHFIESADELEASWFTDASLVGVTAGASTPEYQISRVVDALNRISAG